jgi:DNA-binding NarL/FixJ family response regulator
MKAFIVDDDEISLLLTKHLLQLEGVDQVKTFAGAEKALDYLLVNGPQALPDAILLDLNMPLMNGGGRITILPGVKANRVVFVQRFAVHGRLGAGKPVIVGDFSVSGRVFAVAGLEHIKV